MVHVAGVGWYAKNDDGYASARIVKGSDKVILFPDEEELLVGFKFEGPKGNHGEVDINWTIYFDREKPERGVLKVVFP